MAAPIPKVVPARPSQGRRAGDDYGVSDLPDWRGVDWIAHQHRTRAAGAQLNYVDIGSGDKHPIVFIHGLGGQWQNWLENIPRFAQERRVIAVDLPGFGLSPMPSEQISIEFYGRVVADLCDQLGLGPCVLVGNSMGGYIASELAIKRPELVERLMLISAAGVSQMDMAKRPGHGRDQGRRPGHRDERGPATCRGPPAPQPPLGAAARGPPPHPAGGRLRIRGADEGHRQARLR